MKRKLLFRTILLAAMLGMGTSGWAYEVPEGYEIKTVYVGTNNGDGTVAVDEFNYESVPSVWEAQDGCALSINNITYVENVAVGTAPENKPTYVNGKTLCTTVSGTNWTYHYSRYTMAEAVNSGCLVFRADMYCSNSPTYIRFLDEEENEVLRLGFNNGSNDKYYQYAVNGGSASNSDMHTNYRSYKGFALEDLVINVTTGAVSFWLDYINTNSSSQRKQLTNTKNINIGTGKNIKYLEVGSVVNNSQSVCFDNMKFYYIDRNVNKYTYSIKAVDENNNVLATLASGTCYSDDPATVKWSKYIKVNDVWYKTSSSTFKKSITETVDEKITYVPANISYFYEMENLTRSGGVSTTETSESYSNGIRIRLARNSVYYTPALAGGTYRISIPWENGNQSESEVYVYTRTSGGVLPEEKLATFNAPKGSGTFKAILVIPDGYSLAFKGNEGGSSNNNARMDYMILEQVVPVTIPAGSDPTGYATLSSAFPLDCGNLPSGVKAYKVASVNKTDKKVVLAEVTGAVEAGTGLIISGTPGQAYNIPVAASGSAVDGNLLKAAVTATDVTAGQAYGLKDGKFVKLNAGTIPAGKAYLLAETQAPELDIDFGGVTGISTMHNSQCIMHNEIYDLQGRKVAQPTKGLYIVNGKKVIVK